MAPPWLEGSTHSIAQESNFSVTCRPASPKGLRSTVTSWKLPGSYSYICGLPAEWTPEAAELVGLIGAQNGKHVPSYAANVTR